MRSDTSARGADAEQRALEYLERQGLVPVARNFRGRQGEIDLVMGDGETLVFVEVRFRRSDRFGSAAESVTPTKQQRIAATARLFLGRHPRWREHDCRFDVVTLSGMPAPRIAWIRDAFRP